MTDDRNACRYLSLPIIAPRHVHVGNATNVRATEQKSAAAWRIVLRVTRPRGRRTLDGDFMKTYFFSSPTNIIHNTLHENLVYGNVK